jgi:hypothetical protein
VLALRRLLERLGLDVLILLPAPLRAFRLMSCVFGYKRNYIAPILRRQAETQLFGTLCRLLLVLVSAAGDPRKLGNPTPSLTIADRSMVRRLAVSIVVWIVGAVKLVGIPGVTSDEKVHLRRPQSATRWWSHTREPESEVVRSSLKEANRIPRRRVTDERLLPARRVETRCS